jgi:hypothetical protein
MTDKLIPVSAIAPLVEKWRYWYENENDGISTPTDCADELSEAIAGARVVVTDEMMSCAIDSYIDRHTDNPDWGHVIANGHAECMRAALEAALGGGL